MKQVRKDKRIKPGEWGRALMPHSEVCMHMQIAGKVMPFHFVSERCVQLLNEDGTMFSFPILTGEAGIFQDVQGYYYYPGSQVLSEEL